MKQFQKRVEDFECAHCGAAVAGNGYTNHCPQCLWSKHVDEHPGDRSATCLGLMEPVALEGTVARYRIVHCCTVCGKTTHTDSARNDNPDALVALAQAFADKATKAS